MTFENEEIKSIDYYTFDFSFETIFEKLKHGNLELCSVFKKTCADDKTKKWIEKDTKSRFIESCLLQMPLPVFYFAEEEKTVNKTIRVVIDGMQRIVCVQNFLNNEFCLNGLLHYKELNNKTYKDLDKKHQNILLNTMIRCIVLRKTNSEEIIQSIYYRLNMMSELPIHAKAMNWFYGT